MSGQRVRAVQEAAGGRRSAVVRGARMCAERSGQRVQQEAGRGESSRLPTVGWRGEVWLLVSQPRGKHLFLKPG